MKLERKLQNGAWVEASETLISGAERLENILARNLSRQPRTRQELTDALVAGEILPCGSDWYEQMRDADAATRMAAQHKAKIAQPVMCDCGHYSNHPQMGHWGTECPDCYDK